MIGLQPTADGLAMCSGEMTCDGQQQCYIGTLKHTQEVVVANAGDPINDGGRFFKICLQVTRMLKHDAAKSFL